MLKEEKLVEKMRILADFSMEIKIKDALIKKLQGKEQGTKEVLRKLIKMIEHPRLVIMANKLLHAEKNDPFSMLAAATKTPEKSLEAIDTEEIEEIQTELKDK